MSAPVIPGIWLSRSAYAATPVLLVATPAIVNEPTVGWPVPFNVVWAVVDAAVPATFIVAVTVVSVMPSGALARRRPSTLLHGTSSVMRAVSWSWIWAVSTWALTS